MHHARLQQRTREAEHALGAERFIGARDFDEGIALVGHVVAQRGTQLAVIKRTTLREAGAAHERRAGLRFQRTKRGHGQTRAARVAHTCPLRTSEWANRFVAVEPPLFDGDGSVAAGELQRAQHQHAFDDLCVVVIHRVLHERPHHRVVGAVGGESFATGQRGAKARARGRAHGQHGFVYERVWMATVGVALAVHTRVELTAAQRIAFEVQRAGDAQRTPRRIAQHVRLREVAFGVAATEQGRVGGGEQPRSHGADVRARGITGRDVGDVLRPAHRGNRRGEQGDNTEQSPSVHGSP